MKAAYLLALAAACAASAIAPAHASRPADVAAALQPKATAGFDVLHAQQFAKRRPGPTRLNPQPEPPSAPPPGESRPMTVQPPPSHQPR